MGTNSNSVVVSFSIAILLLLLLLLLLTYNSKCNMQNMSYERFANEESLSDPLISKRNQSGGKSVATFANENIDLNNVQGKGNPLEPSESMSRGNEIAQPLVQQFNTNSHNNDVITEQQTQSSEGFMNYAPVNSSGQLTPPNLNKGEFQSCFPRDRLTADDLLPKDAANSKWARLNPSGTGDIHDQNYLTAGYHIGINTVGQSLRNANLQLRSEIPNPQIPVGPWMISTIEPDLRQNTLEIGSSPSY
jgi:hypothetical protein